MSFFSVSSYPLHFFRLTGPGLVLKNEMISNNSVVKRDDIGTDDDALYCVTDAHTCHETLSCLPESQCSCNCTVIGNWYTPNNGKVNSCSDTNNPYCESCLKCAVLLNYHGDGIRDDTGLFRCEIKSKTSAHHFYTCIYGDDPDDFNCKVHSSVIALLSTKN